MKKEYKKVFQQFIDNKIDALSYLRTLEEWNRSGLWDELSDKEYRLMSNYMHVYADMYYGEVIPKFSFWEKIKRRMNGEADVDLATLKKGTANLVTVLNVIREKSQA